MNVLILSFSPGEMKAQMSCWPCIFTVCPLSREEVLIDPGLVCATASHCCFIKSGLIWSFILGVLCLRGRK